MVKITDIGITWFLLDVAAIEVAARETIYAAERLIKSLRGRAAC